jgi:NAD(P)-dependent dehydrogenase (short-subunit alcohol dehydrogenase family)
VSLPATPSLRLDGRRALVTGAGRGIGLACASAAALRGAGHAADHAAFDVTDLPAMRAAVAAHGPFHAFVNNAGGARHAPFLEVTEADYDAVMALNLRAAFFAAQAVARGMEAAGIRGSIVNVSSQMGHVGGPRRSVYAASKHALEGLTKAMAIELGPLGIRVNTLCPTFIETPMTAPMFRDAGFRDWVLSNIRLGRVGRPEDLMGAATFLASDASALMTGSALVVDGGWTAA